LNKLGVSLVILATLSAAACESPQQKIATKEDRLIAAGFKFKPIDSPARQAAIQQLPPNKFAREVRGDRVFYVYSDPTVCGCLYVGDQRAYGAYRANLQAKRLADEQAMAASEMEMASWDWGPWGGYPMGWYY
jgi:hypothetical protein